MVVYMNKKFKKFKVGDVVDYEGCLCNVVGVPQDNGYYWLEDRKTKQMFEAHISNMVEVL